MTLERKQCIEAITELVNLCNSVYERNKPKWASELTDDEWTQYCYGDIEIKYKSLIKFW